MGLAEDIAAWTYSRVRSDSTSPRTTRVTGGQQTMAIATTMEPSR